MGKNQKILLGALTALPLLLHLWVLAGFLGLFSGLAAQPNVAPGDLSWEIARIVVPAAVGGFLQLGLLVFYIWRLLSHPPGEPNALALWILAMVFLGPLAMLYYWGVHIWPDAPRSTRSGRPGRSAPHDLRS